MDLTLPPPTAEVKHEWSYTSTSLHVFMELTGQLYFYLYRIQNALLNYYNYVTSASETVAVQCENFKTHKETHSVGKCRGFLMLK